VVQAIHLYRLHHFSRMNSLLQGNAPSIFAVPSTQSVGANLFANGR
jgi:hypothetical protein